MGCGGIAGRPDPEARNRHATPRSDVVGTVRAGSGGRSDAPGEHLPDLSRAPVRVATALVEAIGSHRVARVPGSLRETLVERRRLFQPPWHDPRRLLADVVLAGVERPNGSSAIRSCSTTSATCSCHASWRMPGRRSASCGSGRPAARRARRRTRSRPSPRRRWAASSRSPRPDLRDGSRRGRGRVRTASDLSTARVVRDAAGARSSFPPITHGPWRTARAATCRRCRRSSRHRARSGVSPRASRRFRSGSSTAPAPRPRRPRPRQLAVAKGPAAP